MGTQTSAVNTIITPRRGAGAADDLNPISAASLGMTPGTDFPAKTDPVEEIWRAIRERK